MRLKSIRIRNFRAIEDLQVELAPQTAILGGNGCGKSTILRAMDRFFGQQSTMEADDFFGRDLNRPIELELTFVGFNDTEAALFASRIHHAEMTVTRVFESGGGKTNGRYYGSTLKHPGFTAIRAIDAAVEKRAAYTQLRGSDPRYASLPAVTRADQLQPALELWERDNPGACELGRDDGQFFGFTNVAKGALQKATSFVFVPAVRDASADSVDAKGAVIAKLMELVVRSAIQRRRDIREFQARVASDFRELTDPTQLPELGGLADILSDTLRLFYQEACVALRWRQSEEFTIPLPAADVFLNEDGFEGPVDRKGHGLQRAFIVTLLQHLARAASQAAELAESELAATEAGAAPLSEADSGLIQAVSQDVRSMPGLILAIEEPELYQHPTKQRHFARVLSELSSGGVPGVAASTQVIFASHSSLFVSVDRFEQIRIARRVQSLTPDIRTCDVRAATLEGVARILEQVHLHAEGSFTAESLRMRLHTLGPELAEGFFANLVVLVEGVSDRAAILATAEAEGVSLEALGIAVLPADGKSNLDRPATIFAEFGIPTYVVWDCDSGEHDATSREQAVSANRALQRLCGESAQVIFDFATTVRANHACFNDSLESTLREEIGEERFDRLLDAAKARFGIAKRKHALKTHRLL